MIITFELHMVKSSWILGADRCNRRYEIIWPFKSLVFARKPSRERQRVLAAGQLWLRYRGEKERKNSGRVSGILLVPFDRWHNSTCSHARAMHALLGGCYNRMPGIINSPLRRFCIAGRRVSRRSVVCRNFSTCSWNFGTRFSARFLLGSMIRIAAIAHHVLTVRDQRLRTDPFFLTTERYVEKYFRFWGRRGTTEDVMYSSMSYLLTLSDIIDRGYKRRR